MEWFQNYFVPILHQELGMFVRLLELLLVSEVLLQNALCDLSILLQFKGGSHS